MPINIAKYIIRMLPIYSIQHTYFSRHKSAKSNNIFKTNFTTLHNISFPIIIKLQYHTQLKAVQLLIFKLYFNGLLKM